MNTQKYDYLIVGAGLFGATFARMATDAGCRCLVVEKKSHVGGNIYCEKIAGINVHKYGAHIFHTSDERVWSFVNKYVKFNRYTNSPVAIAPDNNLYNLPFNLNTFHSMWGVKTPQEAIEIIDEQRRDAMRQYGSEPANLEQQALLLVGRDIYNLLIKGYTEKQWGRPCEMLPAFIVRRLPVRLTFDNNYFNDLYQGIPEGGYNKLIDRLLEGSELMLSTDYIVNREQLDKLAPHVVYTGEIDRFYGYKFGHLEYRSVKFDTQVLPVANSQGNAVVNYTSADVPFTRIIEHKHFEVFGDKVYENPQTVISKEYPSEWKPGIEPYYPINDDRNTALYKQYKELADADSHITFGGRLAEYKYYDMAPVIASAMDVFAQLNNKLNK